MIRAILTRLQQRYRTIVYPTRTPVLPDRFRGLPRIERARCAADCAACVAVCPVQAITKDTNGITLDLGRCLFCGACEAACAYHAVTFTREHRLAAGSRAGLRCTAQELPRVTALQGRMHALFGRSLKLRQVCAGGCNACEADINVLNTVVFDLGRFGIQFVAAPRHADGMLITGPVTANMRGALEKTWQAVPAPKLVIAVGACAISGGPYRDQAETHNGADTILPVDLYIPGCPPHPLTILDGLLQLLGKGGDFHPV